MEKLLVNEIIQSNYCNDLTQSNQLFQKVNELLNNNIKTTLDFTKINSVNSMFFNSLLNNLYDYNSLDKLRQNLEISNLNKTDTELFYNSLNQLESHLNKEIFYYHED